MKLIVSTVDFRLALKAVAPHVHPDKDLYQYHRIRLEVGPENVIVSATNTHTLGVALVSIWEHEDGELGVVDLSPTNAKEILALFKGKAGGEDDPGDSLRIEVDEKNLTVTDISGMFPGKSWTVPRTPVEDNYPDIGEWIRKFIRLGRKKTARLSASGTFLTLFAHAAKAYGEPLVVDPVGDSSMLITCGDSFLGVLMPVRLDDDQQKQVDARHQAWIDRVTPPESTS